VERRRRFKEVKMSLNWNVANVKDHDNVCFYKAEKNDPDTGLVKGERYLKGYTDALVWLTMSVGLDEITEDNIDEWMYRLSIEYAFQDSTVSRCVNGEWERMYHDENSLRQHIGLYTNAGTISRDEFHAKIIRILAHKGQDIIKYATEQNEKFEEKHKMTDKGWVSR
jgi:hypothetical protein